MSCEGRILKSNPLCSLSCQTNLGIQGDTGQEELSQLSHDVNLDYSENSVGPGFADLDRNELQNEGTSQDPHRSNTPNHASLASVNYPHDSTTLQGTQTSDEDKLHQKPITGYTSQSLLLYNQSSLILVWTVHYVI